MSFWTGLEALTGHRPGAFTGFSMKDLFEKDMWDRLPRTWSGKMGTPEHLKANPMDQRLSRGGEPMMTNWYNRNAGSGPTDSVNQNIDRRMQGLYHQNLGAYPSMRANYPAMPAQVQTFPLQESNITSKPLPVPGGEPPRNPAEVIQETGPYLGMGDPYSGWGGYLGSAKNAHMGMGASGYKVPPVPQFDSTMADMTTVKTITDDATPNKITQTIRQKVPANPTTTLMNMGDAYRKSTGVSNNFRNPSWNPDWPTLSGAASALGRLVNPVGNHLIHGWDTLNELRRKRHEDAMRARGGY